MLNITTLNINGLTYRVGVAGSGAPVLLLHGFTGKIENWMPVIPALAADYQVIAVDLPGHGGTSAPVDAGRYRMEAAAADLAAVVGALALPPVHLAAYSMGGRLALYTARHHPDAFRSVILESASPGLRTPQERAERRASDEALAKRIERDGLAAFVDNWERLPLFASQRTLPVEVLAQIRRLRLANDPVGLANSLRGMGTGVQPSLWADLPEIRLPVLLLTGALDHKFTQIATEMQPLLPDSRLVTVPDVGHTIHLEQPGAWIAAIRQFINQVTARV